jgi:hypothetical protein
LRGAFEGRFSRPNSSADFDAQNRAPTQYAARKFFDAETHADAALATRIFVHQISTKNPSFADLIHCCPV